MVGINLVVVIGATVAIVPTVLMVGTLIVMLVGRLRANRGPSRMVRAAAILGIVLGSAIVAWTIYFAVHSFNKDAFGGSRAEAINLAVDQSGIGVSLFVIGLGLAGFANYVDARLGDIGHSAQ